MKSSAQTVWLDGKFVDSSKAVVPIVTHSMQYGSGIFEGIRSYKTKDGAGVFRLRDHIKRFINSAKIMEMKLGFSERELSQAVLGTVKRNKLTDSYIRPFAFYNDANIGLGTFGKKISVAVYSVYMGNYFANKNRGITCAVSSWRRINPAILPTEAKVSGNYVNSIIASIEAKNRGAEEAILLSQEGFVAEGSAENIFLVEKGVLVTPSKEADILLGITRDTVMKIAESTGMEVEEREIHREELYTCDELFFTGTAAEITPIVKVDSRKVGNGRIGMITSAITDNYAKAVRGEFEEFEGWTTPI